MSASTTGGMTSTRRLGQCHLLHERLELQLTAAPAPVLRPAAVIERLFLDKRQRPSSGGQQRFERQARRMAPATAAQLPSGSTISVTSGGGTTGSPIRRCLAPPRPLRCAYLVVHLIRRRDESSVDGGQHHVGGRQQPSTSFDSGCSTRPRSRAGRTAAAALPADVTTSTSGGSTAPRSSSGNVTSSSGSSAAAVPRPRRASSYFVQLVVVRPRRTIEQQRRAAMFRRRR